ncbi:MAG: HK97 gp10 family phage protein [Neisseria sp.]|nr:HK97 gp10 family phage protein [Neisseria sp.]
MYVKFELIDREHLSASLQRTSPAIMREVKASIAALIIRLQRNVTDRKLSGQVLNKRSGTLARSIDQTLNADADRIIGEVGTNLFYARVHEYGYNGTANVKEHLRRVTQAWGKSLKQPKFATVRAHARAVNFPERSFLRTALEDLRPAIEQEITAAVERGLNVCFNSRT